MENRNVKDRKLVKICIALSIVMLFVVAFITKIEYDRYVRVTNKSINQIVNNVKEKYPDISDKEIIEILNGKTDYDSGIIRKMGISIEKDGILEENDKLFTRFLIINVLSVIVFAGVLILIFVLRSRSRYKEIRKIVKYIEEINKKNYALEIDDLSEDELSFLKTEIYKTTVMLKETAENSMSDKIELKNSLEDISHQIKTPLTSIVVMLDNIIEDPDMDPEVRLDFIMDIKRNINNINFLIQVLLKLSKFDSNTIKFIESEEKLGNIVTEAAKNVESLCDLKNIHLNIKGNEEAAIKCDKKWQIEAVTNIIKNCVEHSSDDSKIDITYDESNVYNEIVIRDYGEGISDKDLPHIFERFYKSAASKNDSFGIGLALAKKIIESNNGNISVDRMDVGTKFAIKYFKF